MFLYTDYDVACNIYSKFLSNHMHGYLFSLWTCRGITDGINSLASLFDRLYMFTYIVIKSNRKAFTNSAVCLSEWGLFSLQTTQYSLSSLTLRSHDTHPTKKNLFNAASAIQNVWANTLIVSRYTFILNMCPGNRIVSTSSCIFRNLFQSLWPAFLTFIWPSFFQQSGICF